MFRRTSSFLSAARVLRDARRPGAPGIRERLAATPRMLRDALVGRYDGLSRGRLVLLVLAAVYVVSPVDLVPEAALLLLGLADDVLVLGWLTGALLVETERYLAWEAGRGAADRVVPGTVVGSAA